jgi:hypothetical protein
MAPALVAAQNDLNATAQDNTPGQHVALHDIFVSQSFSLRLCSKR